MQSKLIAYIIAVILMGYNVVTDFFSTSIGNQNNYQPSSVEPSIKLTNTEVQTDKVIQEYALVLNSKKQTLKVEYTYECFADEFCEVTGKLNDIDVYAITDGIEDFNKSNRLNKSFIDSKFNISNFHFIKGEDNKYYLAISTNRTKAGFYQPYYNELYIFNDNIVKINTDYIIIENGAIAYHMEDDSKWYKDTFNVCQSEDTKCHIFTKIENNKIYYLTPKLFDCPLQESNNHGNIEEREYTIKNNNLNYKVLNKYKIVNIEGQSC